MLYHVYTICLLTKYDPHDDNIATSCDQQNHREYQRPEELLPPWQIEWPCLINENAVVERLFKNIRSSRLVQRLLDKVTDLHGIQPKQQCNITLQNRCSAIIQMFHAIHIYKSCLGRLYGQFRGFVPQLSPRLLPPNGTLNRFYELLPISADVTHNELASNYHYDGLT